MATQSSINIALSADTSGLNKNMAQAAQTVEQGAKRMAETSQKAGEAIANALGNMSVRDAIKEVSQAINDQKAITLEYQKQLQSLRDKSAAMSAADIKGQRALRKEIDAVKAAIAGQKLGIADLIQEKKVLEAELQKEIDQEKQLAKATTEANKASKEQKTVNGATRASLNGLATSFSSVSSIMAIVADDNKELRNALMATNAALNFTAAAMQVRDLSKEFGGLGNAAKDVGNWIKANPYLVAAAAITAIGIAVASVETEAEKLARIQAEVNKELADATSGAMANAVSLNAYLDIVNDTTKSESQRKGALLALKEAGIAVDDLNIKTAAGLRQLNARVQDSINLSIQKAIVDKAASKIAEIELGRIEKLNTLRREGASILGQMRERFLPGYIASMNESNAVNDEAQAATQLYTDAIKNASSQVAQLTPNVEAANNAQTNYNKGIKQGAKDAASLEKQLKKLEDGFQKLAKPETSGGQFIPLDPMEEAKTEQERILDDITKSQEKFEKKGPLTSEDIFGADEVAQDVQVITTEIGKIPPAYEEMANRSSEAFRMHQAEQRASAIKAEEWAQKQLQALDKVNAAFATLQSEAAVSFGQFIGDLVSGEQDAGKNFGKNMLGAIASFMDSLGKALIATAVASEAFQKLILTNPIAAAAAGVALVAGAAIVRNSLKEGPEVTAFAQGGIVSGPTLGLMGEYPNARSNPEVIAPLDKLQGMLNTGSQSGFVASTTITGRDLAIVLERYNKDSKRG
jgi:chromosome segregation ATPase